jgi:hypothetical protein
MNPLIQFRTTILPLLIAFALACFALFPSVQAAPDPAPPPPSNTRDGQGAMAHITTGINNSAFGTNALNKLTTGNNNAAQGNSALFSNTSGSGNVALGSLALRLNTVGVRNTAIGYAALSSFNPAVNSDDAEFGNTAVGWKALSKTSGSSNVAVGGDALTSNTIGNENVAIGFQALVHNTTASNNVAVGTLALLNNTRGFGNTANGDSALVHNTIGAGNVANGTFALLANESGVANVAVGYSSLTDNTTGDNNTAIGYLAGNNITGNGNVCIGQGVVGVAGESNTTRIRNVYASVAATRAVYVTSSNKLGTLASSRRFKDDIQPMDKASEAILALKPVTFRYKQEVDPEGIPQFGLVAEDVAKVNPDLVARDAKGEVYTVRYEAVNAMLLNEFLKEHREVQELKATAAKQEAKVATQDATIAEQQEQIEALTAGLQKVSDLLELSKPAPRIVLNDQ